MRQRTRLFIWIGSLFLLATLLFCLFPKFMIKKDLKVMFDSFKERIDYELYVTSKMHQKTFQDILDAQNLILNRTLLYLYEDAKLHPTDQQMLWKNANRILAFSPEINFLQLSGNEKNVVGINLNKTVNYSSYAAKLTNSIALVALQGDSFSIGPFLALRFPMTKMLEQEAPKLHTPFEITPDDALSIYYLYPLPSLLTLSQEQIQKLPLLIPLLKNPKVQVKNDPVSRKEEAIELFYTLKQQTIDLEKMWEEAHISTLKDLSTWLHQKNGSLFAPSFIQELQDTSSKKQIDNSSYLASTLNRNKLINLTREYIYYMLTYVEASPFELAAPVGATSFTQRVQANDFSNFMGNAFLNQDIFFQEPVFDAKNYYQTHLPDKDAPPIATGLAPLNISGTPDIIISKVMNLTESGKPPLFLTIGSSILGKILETFPNPSTIAIFLNPDNSFHFAVNASGEILNDLPLESSDYAKTLSKPFGNLTIGNTIYRYFEVGNQKDLPIKMFILSPESSLSLYYFETLIEHQMQATGSKLFLQILVLGLLTLGIVLIILAFLSKKITKPISMITLAAEEVAEGHFDHLQLPKLKNNSDEISILASSFSRMVSGLQAKEKMRSILDKVVSKEIADVILKGQVELGGELKHATILFSDIRGYTKLSENTPPDKVIKYLNHYMTEMSKIIEQEGGVIDKYVGDEIMALYGVPVDLPNDADKAVHTAILMMQKLPEINELRKQENRPPIRIGIGIHTGEVVAGNMGAEDRLNYTVLGANVNLASRLCSAADPMQIRISKETLDALTIKDSLIIETIEAMEYKGFSKPIETYSVKGYKAS